MTPAEKSEAETIKLEAERMERLRQRGLSRPVPKVDQPLRRMPRLVVRNIAKANGPTNTRRRRKARAKIKRLALRLGLPLRSVPND